MNAEAADEARVLDRKNSVSSGEGDGLRMWDGPKPQHKNADVRVDCCGPVDEKRTTGGGNTS